MSNTKPYYQSHFSANEIDEAIRAGIDNRLLNRSVIITSINDIPLHPTTPNVYKYELKGVYGEGDVNYNSDAVFTNAPILYFVGSNGIKYDIDYTLYQENNVWYADIALNTNIGGNVYEVGTLLSAEIEPEIEQEYDIVYKYHNYNTGVDYTLATTVSKYRYKSATPLPTTATITVGGQETELEVTGWMLADPTTGGPIALEYDEMLERYIFPDNYKVLHETPYDANTNITLYAIVERNIKYVDLDGDSIINNIMSKYYYPVDIGHEVSIIANPFEVAGINTANNVYITGWRRSLSDTDDIDTIIIGKNDDGIADTATAYLNGIDTTDEGLTYSIASSIATITGVVASGTISEQLAIPHYLGNCRVSIIGQAAFRNQTAPTTILFTDYITAIDDSAFTGCSGLVEFDLPTSLSSIGDSAFAGCSSMTSFVIPDSVTILEDSALSGCTSLVVLTIGNGITALSNGLLRNCTALETLTIGDGVTSIGNNTLDGCTGLLAITIGRNITSISDSAFIGCTSLESIVVNSNNAVYDSRNNCNAIIRTQDNSLIAGCKNTIIPNNIAIIQQYAFNGCIGLTSIRIPDSVTTIGADAFVGCTGLTSIIGSTYMASAVAKQCGSSSFAVELTYGTEIEVNAFYGCTGLTSIYIPVSIINIRQAALGGCISLSTIDYHDGTVSQWLNILKGINWDQNTGNYTIYCKDGEIAKDGTITRYGTEGLIYTLNQDGQSYSCTGIGTATDLDIVIATTYGSLPVTGVGSGAFLNCNNLTSVIIPNSVTSIGAGAFSGCSSLKHMEIPFVGGSASATVASPSTLFGYIFGTQSYTGSAEVDQVYGASNQIIYYIPAELRSVIVTGNATGEQILYGAFSDMSASPSWNLSSITLLDGVTKISYGAFAKSSNSSLRFVKLSNSITNIEPYAFFNCSQLFFITYDGTIAQWNDIHKYNSWNASTGNYTIYCTDGSIAKDGSTAATSGLTYTLNSDGQSYSCSGIGTATANNIIVASVYEDKPVTGISYNAFANSVNLQTIIIPNSVTSIGSGAFKGCENLQYIKISDNVALLNGAAFRNCSRLNTVMLGDGITAIRYNTFENCNLLNMIVTQRSAQTYMSALPNSVTSIESRAFYSCTGLTSVVIPNSVASIDSSAFYNCTSLTSITIPDSVTSIEGSAFEDCSSLTSISIGNGISYIGENAFAGCVNLQYNEYNNAYYLGNITNLYVVLVRTINTSTTSCIINNGCRVVMKGALNGCSSLESIIIPFVGSSASASSASSLTLFGYIFGTTSYTGGTSTKQYYGSGSTDYFTYYIPSSLRNVTVTGGNILYGAFNNCSMLTLITIPNSVISIGNSAFASCTGLTSITLPNSVTSIGGSAFGGCSGLTSVVIPDSVTSMGERVFANCTGLTSVTIGNGVTSIDDYAFQNCTGLTSVTIPNSVTSIGTWAFYNCSGLTSATIGNGVTIIGSSAFQGCISLTSVIIPDSVISIGNSAFANCSGLTSATISNSVTYIFGNTFYGCTGLTSITIPDSVKSIRAYAFGACTGLTSVTIGNRVKDIESYVFGDCTSLTSITYNDTIAQWNAITKGNNWNANTGNYTIHCTDGDISKAA